MTSLLNSSPLQTPDDIIGGFFYEYGGEELELKPSEQLEIVNKISGKFDQMDRAKQPVKERWAEVEKSVRGFASKIKSDRHNALVPLGKQSVQTLLAHFWGRSLATDNVLFSVTGGDKKSKEQAPIYKKALLKLLDKDKFHSKMDKAIYTALLKGVCIAHVQYETITETRRTLSGLNGTEYETDEVGKRVFKDYLKQIKDAATVKIIDPENFVFDTSTHEDWDKCLKIYQTFVNYEDLLADDNFQNVEGLNKHYQGKEATKIPASLRKKKHEQDTNKGFDDKGRIEVLEVHGDVRLPSGKYLRNWTLVIAGRRRLIRFEQNPYYVNPFQKWEYEPAEDGWGYSPISYIVGLIQSSSTLLNTGVEGAKLSINPPTYAPKGMFPQKKIYLTEGMIVEYEQKQAMTQNYTPQPVRLSPQAPFPYLQLFEAQSEATTGATRQLSGNVTTNDKAQTATEFQGLQIVGNLIIDRVIDLFNRDFKLPIIEKYSEITAMYNPQSFSVSIENDDGVEEFQEVQPEHYYGNYEFYIEDNKSELERKQNIQEKIQLIQTMIADPEIRGRVKIIDLVSELWRDMGYGKAGTYIMNDEEYVVNRLSDVATEQVIMELGQQKSMGMLMKAAQSGGDIAGVIREMLQEAAMQGVLLDGNEQQEVIPTQGVDDMAAGGGMGDVQGFGY